MKHQFKNNIKNWDFIFLVHVLVSILIHVSIHVYAHSEILGTDSPPPILAHYNPAVLSVSPGAEKLISPHRQTKNPYNPNMLHLFNNNRYTDFIAA